MTHAIPPPLAPRNLRNVDHRAGAFDPAGALRHRRGEAGRAQVLDRHHSVGMRQVHASFEQALLEERVAHLDSRPALRAVVVELDRGEGRDREALEPGIILDDEAGDRVA